MDIFSLRTCVENFTNLETHNKFSKCQHKPNVLGGCANESPKNLDKMNVYTQGTGHGSVDICLYGPFVIALE